jgi:hypothetical protein
MAKKDVVVEAGAKFLGGLAKKGIAEIKDEKIRSFLGGAWGELEAQLPTLANSLIGHGETVLSGQYKEKTAKILAKMQEDILALKNKEIDAIDFRMLTERRKMAIYALYNAQKATGNKPSIQTILNAAGEIATILVKHGLPFILSII